uniref:Calcium homeostasis modulator 3 n=2 Tax=Latimeria chalumnae TaxID=7897 RepID=M3XHX3_LATCH|nr:PREDICTED: calcium homeostasis modulator protein 3-like isoform X1 [Latimeria chalumnae]|eukprot:XP_014354052.1 PREDICTED: calcium homeostasis modulator protein 3-like isoform X1 [Latimeria chalumnae]
MDRLLHSFQSSSGSLMNVLCAILALTSLGIYKSFKFICPCLPGGFNMLYGLGFMFVPPGIFLFCGLIANKHLQLMLEEWVRPTGRRNKNPAIIRGFFFASITRSLVAPIVWILLSLMDGKGPICAFSDSINPEQFKGLDNITAVDLYLLLSKVPCKTDPLIKRFPSARAVSRYIKAWSQSIGWTIVLVAIMLAALARILKPCFRNETALQNHYWSNYLDMEEKLFHKTCCMENYAFARKYIARFFRSMNTDAQSQLRPVLDEDDYQGNMMDLEQLDALLQSWHSNKPPLDVNLIYDRYRMEYL